MRWGRRIRRILTRRRMRCEYLFDYEGRGEGDGWRMSEIQRGVWKWSTA